jgi:hypothetical protein
VRIDRSAFVKDVVALLAGCALAGAPATSSAQSRQPYGVQLSAFGTGIPVNGGTLGGLGIEGQFRVNRLKNLSIAGGPVSLGLGAQYTTHNSADDYSLKVFGMFIEPRLVITVNSLRYRPYLSARLAVLRQSSDFASSSNGTAAGLGAGAVYRLTSTINLDVGAGAVFQRFSDAKTPAGAPFRFGSLLSYAAKIGLNFGL